MRIRRISNGSLRTGLERVLGSFVGTQFICTISICWKYIIVDGTRLGGVYSATMDVRAMAGSGPPHRWTGLSQGGGSSGVRDGWPAGHPKIHRKLSWESSVPSLEELKIALNIDDRRNECYTNRNISIWQLQQQQQQQQGAAAAAGAGTAAAGGQQWQQQQQLQMQQISRSTPAADILHADANGTAGTPFEVIPII